MSTLFVRQALLSDLPQLVPLFDAYRQFYGKAADPTAAHSFLLERIERAESVLFLAEDGGQGLGFAQLYPCFSSVVLARTYILNDLYVDAGCRRQGVAKRLLETAADYAASAGAVRLTLATAIGNAEARALYQAVGWQRDEQFFVYHLPITS